MSLFAAPALAAWVVHQVWQQPAASIYGELLPPATPRFVGMTDAAGQPADLAALRGRWVLLTVVNGDCAADCRQQLHLARQVRIAQGREQARVAQALIQADSATPVDLALTYRFLAWRLFRRYSDALARHAFAWSILYLAYCSRHCCSIIFC
ncbi:MAG: hypothetical protein Q8O33_06170 [Pseudomonadota bacterium]|nr:hypothetical protein [Pseudomonadota bacterium]